MKTIFTLAFSIFALALGAQVDLKSDATVTGGDSFVHTAYITPNPIKTSGHIGFWKGEDETVTVEIMDLVGKVVMTIPKEEVAWTSKGIKLDLAFMKSGIYFLAVTTQSGEVKTLKFQKT